MRKILKIGLICVCAFFGICILFALCDTDSDSSVAQSNPNKEKEAYSYDALDASYDDGNKYDKDSWYVKDVNLKYKPDYLFYNDIAHSQDRSLKRGKDRSAYTYSYSNTGGQENYSVTYTDDYGNTYEASGIGDGHDASSSLVQTNGGYSDNDYSNDDDSTDDDNITPKEVYEYMVKWHLFDTNNPPDVNSMSDEDIYNYVLEHSIIDVGDCAESESGCSSSASSSTPADTPSNSNSQQPQVANSGSSSNVESLHDFVAQNSSDYEKQDDSSNDASNNTSNQVASKPDDAAEEDSQNTITVSNQRKKFIEYALTLRGTPYYYGGKTPTPGIDCSGFVAFSARKAINVNYTGSAAMMYQNSKKIDSNKAEPGDLVFFSDNGSTISHVGIFLGTEYGRGGSAQRLFVHSASDGSRTGVIVSSLDTQSYWTRHFVGIHSFLDTTSSARSRTRGHNPIKALESSEDDFKNDTWWDDVDPAVFNE